MQKKILHFGLPPYPLLPPSCHCSMLLTMVQKTCSLSANPPPHLRLVPTLRPASLRLVLQSTAHLVSLPMQKKSAWLGERVGEVLDWVTCSTGYLCTIHGVDGMLPFSSSSRGNKGVSSSQTNRAEWPQHRRHWRNVVTGGNYIRLNYTWVHFLAHKSKAYKCFIEFFTMIEA